MKRTTAKEREEHLLRWQRSGLSKRAYCQEAGLNYGTFMSWQSQDMAAEAAGSFVALPLRSQASGAEIIYPNGIRVVLWGEVPLSLLQGLGDV